MSYEAPLSVTSKTIHLISDISSEPERLIIRFEHEDGVRLRKINRMKTIHACLAIEGNYDNGAA